MTWQQYYGQFYDWADSTQVSRISSISDFSGAKTEEIIEAALSFAEEGPATRLIKRALEGGVRFSAEDVLEVLAWVREDFRANFAEKAVTPFAEEDMDALRTLLPEKTVRVLARRSGIVLDGESGFAPQGHAAPQREKPGSWSWGTLFTAFGAFGGGKGGKRHGGRCCGDCSKCPPHYGYRYGRWYDGRHHVYGCEFGGNGHPGKT